MNKQEDEAITLSIWEFFRRFPDEIASVRFMKAKRRGNEKRCPYCDSLSITDIKNDASPIPYRCRNCRKYFSVRTGTVLAESKLPFRNGLWPPYLMASSRKSISSI